MGQRLAITRVLGYALGYAIERATEFLILGVHGDWKYHLKCQFQNCFCVAPLRYLRRSLPSVLLHNNFRLAYRSG